MSRGLPVTRAQLDTLVRILEGADPESKAASADPWFVLGYARSYVGQLIKQKNGELPYPVHTLDAAPRASDAPGGDS